MQLTMLNKQEPVPEAESSLEVENLNVWYGASQVLRDVSLALPVQSITALIGPSGCGISTFLRSLNRMNDLILGVRVEGSCP